jgi:hypothetical protein
VRAGKTTHGLGLPVNEIGVGIAIARNPSSDPDGRSLAHPVLISDDRRQNELRGKDGAHAVEETIVGQRKHTSPREKWC